MLNYIQKYQLLKKYQIIVKLQYKMPTYRNINERKHIEIKINDTEATIT